MYQTHAISSDEISDLLNQFVDSHQGQATEGDSEDLRKLIVRLFEKYGWSDEKHYITGNCFSGAPFLIIVILSEEMLKLGLFEAIRELMADKYGEWMFSISLELPWSTPEDEALGDCLIHGDQILVAEDSDIRFLKFFDDIVESYGKR